MMGIPFLKKSEEIFCAIQRAWRNRNYIHRPFLWVTLTFLLGIYGGYFAKGHVGLALVFLCSFLFLGAIFIDYPKASNCCLLMVVMFCGFIYTHSYMFIPSKHISQISPYYRNDPIKIRGRIISDVEYKKLFHGVKTSFVIEIDSVLIKKTWIECEGKLMVNLFREEELSFGDLLILEGKMFVPIEYEPNEIFSYRQYLKRRNITHIFSIKKRGYVERLQKKEGGIFGFFYRRRMDLKKTFYSYLSETEAGLMQAFILGIRKEIPEHLKRLFEITGVAHLLAISALHLGTVSFILFLLIKICPLPRKLQYGICILCLIFYALLTGVRPSVVRATTMAVVFLASFIFEKESDLVNTLALAALVILLFNPLYLFDVGFQLSFVSVFSIITIFPLFKRYRNVFKINGNSAFLRMFLDSFCLSLSAYLGVAGLIAYYFRIVTPVAVVINLVIIPLFSVLVALGVGILIVHYFFPWVVLAFAICIKVLLNVIVGIIFLVAQVPGCFYTLQSFDRKQVMLYYLFLTIFISLFSLWLDNLEKGINN